MYLFQVLITYYYFQGQQSQPLKAQGLFGFYQAYQPNVQNLGQVIFCRPRLQNNLTVKRPRSKFWTNYNFCGYHSNTKCVFAINSHFHQDFLHQICMYVTTGSYLIKVVYSIVLKRLLSTSRTPITEPTLVTQRTSPPPLLLERRKKVKMFKINENGRQQKRKKKKKRIV